LNIFNLKFEHYTAADNLCSRVNMKSFTLVLSHAFCVMSGNDQFQHTDAVRVFSKCPSAFQIIISGLKYGRRGGGLCQSWKTAAILLSPFTVPWNRPRP